MDILTSHVDCSSPLFKENEGFHLGLKDELRSRLEHVKKGGGEKSIERHRKRKSYYPERGLRRFSMKVRLF